MKQTHNKSPRLAGGGRKAGRSEDVCGCRCGGRCLYVHVDIATIKREPLLYARLVRGVVEPPGFANHPGCPKIRECW